jgi:hypothetical protein
MDDSHEQLRYPIGRYEIPERYAHELQNEWITAIEALPLWLDHCIENLDAHQLDTSYRPGGWTVNQVIHHLAESLTMKSYGRNSPIRRPFRLMYPLRCFMPCTGAGASCSAICSRKTGNVPITTLTMSVMFPSGK